MNIKRVTFKSISILLILFVALSSLNVMCVFAESYSFIGDGTAKNPYLIESFDDYTRFCEYVNGGETFEGIYFKQTEDIVFKTVEYGKTAIYGVNVDKEFAGEYDGAGHSVTCAESYNYISGYQPANLGVIKTTGLFGRLSGTVKNLSATGYWRISTDTGIFAYSVIDGGILINCAAREITVCSELDGKRFFGLAKSDEHSGTAMYNCIFSGTVFNAPISISYPLTNTNGKTAYSYFYLEKSRVAEKMDTSEGILKDSDEMPVMHKTLNENILIIASELQIDKETFVMWKKDGASPNFSGEYWHETGETVYEFEGSGEYRDPYLINTIDDYNRLAKYVKTGETFEGIYFVQTDDITFKPAEKAENEMIEYGLGQTDEFAGIYNGMGHSITLAASYNYISSYDKWGKTRMYQGLFGKLSGIVMNVVVTGYWCNNQEGGIIAHRVVKNGKIINCAATDFSAHPEMVGKPFFGLASTKGYSGVAIYNCYYSFCLNAAGNTKCYPITDTEGTSKYCYYNIASSRNDHNIEYGIGTKVSSDEIINLYENLNDNLLECASESKVPAIDLLMWKARDKKPLLTDVRGPLISDTAFSATYLSGDDYTAANSDYCVNAVTYFKDADDIKISIDGKNVAQYSLSDVFENNITIGGEYIGEGKHTIRLEAYSQDTLMHSAEKNIVADGASIYNIKTSGAVSENSGYMVTCDIKNNYKTASDITLMLVLYDKNGAFKKIAKNKLENVEANYTVNDAKVYMAFNEQDYSDTFTKSDYGECTLYMYVWNNIKSQIALINEIKLS